MSCLSKTGINAFFVFLFSKIFFCDTHISSYATLIYNMITRIPPFCVSYYVSLQVTMPQEGLFTLWTVITLPSTVGQ